MRTRSGVIVVGLLLFATACGSPTTGAAGPSSPTTVASPVTTPSSAGTPSSVVSSGGGACRSKDMAVRLGQPSSAKFQEGTVIELANTGDACVVSGHLGLTLLDDRGAAMPTTVQPLADGNPAGPVTVARGGRAYATLVWNKYEGQGTLCRPYPASLAVSLPGDATTVTAPWISGDDGSACQGALSVSALRATP